MAAVPAGTDRQPCCRRLRNVLALVPAKQRPAAVAMLKTIFAQDTAEAAHAQWRQVADALRERFPKLAELIDGAREDGLAYMTFPRGEHRVYHQVFIRRLILKCDGPFRGRDRGKRWRHWI